MRALLRRIRVEPALWQIPLALVVGLLAYVLSAGVLHPLELAASDLLFRARGELPDPTHTIIVAIDDASFAQMDLRWPWPRDVQAEIVRRIAAGDPAVIAVDIAYSEPSDPAADAALAEAIAEAGNVVLATEITTQATGGVELRQFSRPIPDLDGAAAALGLSNFPLDDDGTVRRLLAYQEHNNDILTSWSLQAARLYLGEEYSAFTADAVTLGADRRVLLDRQHLRVNYGGAAGSIPTVSAYQVLDGTIPPSAFEGQIVLIGGTSVSVFHDAYPTPFGVSPPMAGAEINAHALETILNGRYIAPMGTAARLALALVAALIASFLVLRLRPIPGLAVVTVILFAYGLLAAGLFVASGAILPLVGPGLALGLSFVAGTSLNLYEEQRRRAQVRALFERYVAPSVIEEMLGRPETFALGGQRREMSVLFSDIRGFTSLSEMLDPAEVVAILNEYLTAMTEIIFAHEGMVDKFEGDAIMAVFNAPLPVADHAAQAVRCAAQMIARLHVLQADWEARGHPLRIGIGINTGEAFVGNIGSARRMEYTAIGDAVNLASRLQDLTQEAGVPILFAESTRERLPADLAVRFVQTAQVKGRSQAVNVYTVDVDGADRGD